jgi:hypothetical protein
MDALVGEGLRPKAWLRAWRVEEVEEREVEGDGAHARLRMRRAAFWVILAPVVERFG